MRLQHWTLGALALIVGLTACDDDGGVTGVDDDLNLDGQFQGQVVLAAEQCPTGAEAFFTTRAAETRPGTFAFTQTGAQVTGIFTPTTGTDGPITLTGTVSADDVTALNATREMAFAGTGGVNVERAETFTFTNTRVQNDPQRRILTDFTVAVENSVEGEDDPFVCTRSGTLEVTGV